MSKMGGGNWNSLERYDYIALLRNSMASNDAQHLCDGFEESEESEEVRGMEPIQQYRAVHERCIMRNPGNGDTSDPTLQQKGM